MVKNIIYYPVSEPARQLGSKVVMRGQCDCDCDCACVSAPRINCNDISTSTLLHQRNDLYCLPLTREHAIVVSSKNNGFAVLDTHGQRLLNVFRTPLSSGNASTRLENSEVIRHFISAGLLTTEDDCACITNTSACRSSETIDTQLVAWLHLTDRCNLRCSYCYLPHVREDMSWERAQTAIGSTFRSAITHDYKSVKLKYAGGEPLLRYSTIRDLHDYAKALAEKDDLELEEVVLSNGTLLTEEMAYELKSLGIHLMLSLDGYGAYHDMHRPYSGGRGSFDDVAHAVEIALYNGLLPTISVTVSSRTAEGLPELIKWILERELLFSLNFYRENERSVSQDDLRLNDQKIIHGMQAAFDVIEGNLPRRSLLGGILDRANLSSTHLHTCGVGKNYLVFDQNGQISKCQMQMWKPVPGMNVADPLSTIRADETGIQNISVEDKEGCQTCEWKYWCTGGCPLETHRATGRYDVKSPNCNIYRSLFPEALRLEGLRLLKYQDDPEVVVKY